MLQNLMYFIAMFKDILFWILTFILLIKAGVIMLNVMGPILC